MISIIVPVYNAERWLEEAIASVRASVYEDFEAIMVDDGSSDSSPEILRRVAEEDKRFRIIRRENGGLSAARNTGLDAARGEWITFLDADDMLYPHSLSTLLDLAQRQDADIATGAFSIEYNKENGKVKERIFEPAEALIAGLYQQPILHCAWGKLIKSSVFNPPAAAPLRFEEGKYYEDLEIFPRMLERVNRVAYTSGTVYFYRQHSSSFIHSFSERRLDVLMVTDRIVDYCREHCPEALPAALDRRYSANYNMFLLMSRCCPGAYPEAERQCWEKIKDGRWRALSDPKVRLKNKGGALLSLIGRKNLRRVLIKG